MTTALAIPHAPVCAVFASSDPEVPDFDDVCQVDRELWPCTVAELADPPGARPEPVDLTVLGALSDERPPF